MAKLTLRVAPQTKFQYGSTLKCIVHRLSYYYLDSFYKNIEIREVQKYLHHQRHLQSIGSMEANRACKEQQIK